VNASIAPAMPLKQLGAAARSRLLDALFATRVTIAATRGFDFAEVTRGGVALDEVDPATMESRRVPGLFLCGELLDLDGPIGGYNFTAAFATGALAGRSAASAAES
jgi:predicted flavoprotein YhiN